MLYLLLYPLHNDYGFFNLFRYTSFRMIMASLTALVVALWLFPSVIKRLAAIGTQPIRDDGVAHHVETKAKTPTAGGSLIMASVVFSTLLWGDLQNHYVLVLLAVMTLFALVGWYDDWRKMKYQDTKGLSGKLRLLVEFTVAFGAVYWLTSVGMETRLDLPFTSSWQPDLGVIGTVLFGGFVIVGTANACNLTDGLDGLAIGPVPISAATFGARLHRGCTARRGHRLWCRWRSVRRGGSGASGRAGGLPQDLARPRRGGGGGRRRCFARRRHVFLMALMRTQPPSSWGTPARSGSVVRSRCLP